VLDNRNVVANNNPTPSVLAALCSQDKKAEFNLLWTPPPPEIFIDFHNLRLTSTFTFLLLYYILYTRRKHVKGFVGEIWILCVFGVDKT
jgi:hypothetical protein